MRIGVGRTHRSLVAALAVVLLSSACSSGEDDAAPPTEPVEFPVRGAWFAARSSAAIDSDSAREVLADMRERGVTHVGLGHDVEMPSTSEPELVWGVGDDGLRRAIRDVHEAGMEALLLPRIESPEFFEPPFLVRADIAFETQDGWDRFHDDVEAMLLHYAAIAADEDVALFGVGLELQQSVVGHGDRWREIIAAVREIFPGELTYSANWFEEWEDVSFWDALDYIGVAAYFELDPDNGLGPDAEPVADLEARWRPIVDDLAALSERVDRPMLFTEVGYTGYVDTAERPWEWAGKEDSGVGIDHDRQADAYRAVFGTFGDFDWLQGMFVWTYYAGTDDIADWEYAVQERESERVLTEAYGGG